MSKDIKGHWFECKNKECSKKIPLPDKIFMTPDNEEVYEVETFCPFCNEYQTFNLSETDKSCSKEEALSYFKIQNQIKEGKIHFEAYWDKT